jgi:prepilin-type N-terminal cleavage/methylation domain-containing protein
LTVERSDESGYTLIELLLVIALLGFIVAPISAAIVVGLRTTSATANRINSSHDAQLVSIYLPADIQSATTVDQTGTNTGCHPNSVLYLKWTQLVDPSSNAVDTYEAAYAIAQNDGEWQMTRYYCVNSALVQQTVVAHNLRDGSAATVPLPTGPTVSMTLTEATAARDTAAYQYTVQGTRRTP